MWEQLSEHPHEGHAVFSISNDYKWMFCKRNQEIWIRDLNTMEEVHRIKNVDTVNIAA